MQRNLLKTEVFSIGGLRAQLTARTARIVVKPTSPLAGSDTARVVLISACCETKCPLGAHYIQFPVKRLQPSAPGLFPSERAVFPLPTTERFISYEGLVPFSAATGRFRPACISPSFRKDRKPPLAGAEQVLFWYGNAKSGPHKSDMKRSKPDTSLTNPSGSAKGVENFFPEVDIPWRPRRSPESNC